MSSNPADDTRSDDTRRGTSRDTSGTVTPRRDTHAPLKGGACTVARSVDGARTTIPGARQQFVLLLEGHDGIQPAVVRLRQALKLLLRAFGLKCTRIEEVTVATGRPTDGK